MPCPHEPPNLMGNLNKYKVMTHQSCGHTLWGLGGGQLALWGRGKRGGQAPQEWPLNWPVKRSRRSRGARMREGTKG